jgi:hypothetical protein
LRGYRKTSLIRKTGELFAPPDKEKKMFIWEYLKDFIKKKTCCICGKRERTMIVFRDRTFCAECYKNMVFSQKNKEWRELKNDNIQ